MSHYETIAIEEKIAHLVNDIQVVLDEARNLADKQREARRVREEMTVRRAQQQAA